MMILFRQIADEGKTVVCITHNVENVSLCDLVVVLVGGKLAYYGPPNELPEFFAIARISDVYDRLESCSAEVWEQQYKASTCYREYVLERIGTASPVLPASKPTVPQTAGAQDFSEELRQLQVLTRRYFTILVQDRKNLAILLAQAPLIGLLLGAVLSDAAGGKRQSRSDGGRTATWPAEPRGRILREV